MSDPYDDGYNARMNDDLPLSSNPFSPEDEDYEDWRGGWHDADADIEDDNE